MSLTTSRDHALRLAVWTVIATEAVMFGALLAFRGGLAFSVTAPGLALSCAIAIGLLATSAGVGTSLRRARNGQHLAVGRLLLVAAVVGFAALGLELAGARLASPREPLTVVILGLHAAHVAAGIALTSWMLALVGGRRVQPRHTLMLDLVGTYWYFVAGVWLFIWPLLATAA